MDNILQALALCKWAPSGGNTQPWHIQIEDASNQTLVLRLSLAQSCKDKDLLMEANGAGALYSLGTLSATVEFVLQQIGYTQINEQFIDRSSSYDCQILLRFRKTGPAVLSMEKIENALQRRRSNRHLFRKSPISAAAFEAITRIAKKYPEIRLLEFRKTKGKIARILGMLETLRCQNPKISNEFLEEIHFGPTSEGLPAATLGQPSWSLQMMRIWKRWRALRVQFFLGAQYLFQYLAVVRPIQCSGHLFCLQAEVLSNISIYKVGKLLAECWFELCSQGFAVQVFGLPIFSLLSQLHPNASNILSKRNQTVINVVRRKLSQSNIHIDRPCLLFRAGIAHQQAPLTPRKPMEISINPNLTVPATTIVPEVTQ